MKSAAIHPHKYMQLVNEMTIFYLNKQFESSVGILKLTSKKKPPLRVATDLPLIRYQHGGFVFPTTKNALHLVSVQHYNRYKNTLLIDFM